MRCLSLILCTVLILMANSKAHAQSSNIFDMAASDQIKLSTTINNPIDNTIIKPKTNSDICGDGMCDTPNGGSSSSLQQIRQANMGTQKASFNIYAPVGGLIDIMYSTENADLIDKVMESPNFNKITTLLLTESAVAGGTQAAMQASHDALMARYASEQQFVDQLKLRPDTGVMVGRAYFECVSRNIKAAGGAGADKESWITAQAICQKDRMQQSTSPAKVQAPGGQGGLSFAYDPSLAGAGAGGPASTINLWDYILNEPNLAAFKQSFIELAGDVTFTLNSGAGPSSTVSLDYTYKQPTKTLAAFIVEKMQVNYEGIMGLLAERCKFVAPNKTDANDINNFFCRSTNPRLSVDELAKYSTPAFQFNCGTIDVLYNEFKNSNPDLLLSGTAGATKCNVFTSTAQITALTADPTKLTPGHTAVASLASNIAVGQAYLMLLYIEETLNKVSSERPNGLKGFIRPFVDQLMADLVKGENVQDRYVEAMDAINKNLIPGLIASVGKTSGQRGNIQGQSKGRSGIDNGPVG